jgi:hypothetical protein
MDWTQLLQILGGAGGLLGAGGLGGVFIQHRRLKSHEKQVAAFQEVQILEIKADLEVSVREAAKKLIDDLQEESDRKDAKITRLEAKNEYYELKIEKLGTEQAQLRKECESERIIADAKITSLTKEVEEVKGQLSAALLINEEQGKKRGTGPLLKGKAADAAEEKKGE